MAWQVMRSCPHEVEFDELLSAGTIGLIQAIESYDPSRGLAFSTLAAPRIRGAILDDLRKRDVVPRSVRRRHRKVTRTKESLMQRLNRAPDPEETAAALGIGLEDYWRWKEEAEKAQPISLDQPRGEDGERTLTLEELSSRDEVDELEENLTREEELRILREEILKLGRQERVVLSLYYFEGLKLHEIAEVLGVTESRISQIRSKAIQQLRVRLAHLREGSRP